MVNRVEYCPQNGCFMENGAAPQYPKICKFCNTRYLTKLCSNCKRCSNCGRVGKKYFKKS